MQKTETQLIADKLKEQGNQQLKMENYDKAIDLYNRAINHDQSNYAYYHNRSLAYFLLENMVASLKDALKCRELNADYLPGHIRVVAALTETDQLPEALAAIELALKIESKNAKLLALKARVTSEIEAQTTERSKLSARSLLAEENLLNYVHTSSGEFSAIRLVHHSESNRSVIARRVIQPQELIMSIPLNSAITLDYARSSSFYDASAKFSSDKHVAFALCLLEESTKKSSTTPFLPFIESMPTDFSHFPAFYSAEELELLTGSSVLKKINEQLLDMQSDYNTAKATSAAFAAADIPFKKFQEALLLSHSRVFKVEINQQQSSIMVPLADMCNHAVSGSEEAEWKLNETLNTFEVRAVKRIAKGAEIRFTYGSKCNSMFIINYGFIEDATKGTGSSEALVSEYKRLQLEEIAANKKSGIVNPKQEVIKQEYFGINKFNELPVLYSFDEDDATLPLKAKLLKVDTLPKACLIKIIEDFEHANSTGWLGYLRFIAIRDPVQLAKLFEAHKKFTDSTNQPDLPFLPLKTPPISVENESAMWSKVQELLIPQLLAFKTSVKKDYDILKSEDLSENTRNAVLLRLGEKQIIEFYIRMANKMMGFLSGMEKKEILEAARTDPENAPYFHYIIQVILARLLYQK